MSETDSAETNGAELSRVDQANIIVRNYTLATFVPAALPLPYIDLVLIMGVQLKMLHSLSNLYGVDFSKDIGKEAIAVLIGGVMPGFLTPVMMSMIQVIPFIGQAAGAIGLMTLAGALTYAIGKVFIQHFESGGTILTFDPAKVREHFAQEYELGKSVVNNLKEEKKGSSS